MKHQTATCETHRARFLLCDAFDRLVDIAGTCCQVCGVPFAAERLVLDHDHQLGLIATRGVVCMSCNTRLGQVDNGTRPPTTAEAEYLACPYWKTLAPDDLTKRGRYWIQRVGDGGELSRKRAPGQVMITFRCADEDVAAAKEAVAALGSSISDECRRALRNAVKRAQRNQPEGRQR